MRINPSNSGTPPTNPYHIARAYGVTPAARTSPAAAMIAGARQAAPGDVQDFAQREGVRKLIAGVVPGGVQFDAGGEAQPAAPSLPMYRHPADKNAAATAVSVGRSLDVRG